MVTILPSPQMPTEAMQIAKTQRIAAGCSGNFLYLYSLALFSPSQREAIQKATPADRRGLLMQSIGPRFMEAGQSPEELSTAIETFLSPLPGTDRFKDSLSG